MKKKVSDLLDEARALMLLEFPEPRNYIYAHKLIGITSSEYNRYERRVISTAINYKFCKFNLILPIRSLLGFCNYIDDSKEWFNGNT